MFRLILISLAAAWLVRFLLRLAPSLPPRRRRQEVRRSSGGEMIPCAACGTFVLEGEALGAGSARYCSEGCRAGRVSSAPA